MCSFTCNLVCIVCARQQQEKEVNQCSAIWKSRCAKVKITKKKITLCVHYFQEQSGKVITNLPLSWLPTWEWLPLVGGFDAIVKLFKEDPQKTLT